VGDEFFDIAALDVDGGGGLDAKYQQRSNAEDDLKIESSAQVTGNTQTDS
jgi:hypothetical protein